MTVLIEHGLTSAPTQYTCGLYGRRLFFTNNDGLTRSGTGCFLAVPIWQQWTSKG